MMRSLLLPLALLVPAAPAVASGAGDPPVRVSLNSDARYQPGASARIHVRTQNDGYVVVLRTDVDGWVRVLYPVDPSTDAFVKGGREFEVRGRGDRDAFTVASSHSGNGRVLAAYSAHPFNFDQFIRNDHWDYRALDSLRSESDPEAALVDIAQAMAGSGDFDYDVQTYTVGDGSRHYYYPEYASAVYYPACYGCYRSNWAFGIGFGFGVRPWYRAGLYSPFYSDPFLWDASCWTDLFCYPGAYWRPWGWSYIRPYPYYAGSGWYSPWRRPFYSAGLYANRSYPTRYFATRAFGGTRLVTPAARTVAFGARSGYVRAPVTRSPSVRTASAAPDRQPVRSEASQEPRRSASDGGGSRGGSSGAGRSANSGGGYRGGGSGGHSPSSGRGGGGGGGGGRRR